MARSVSRSVSTGKTTSRVSRSYSRRVASSPVFAGTGPRRPSGSVTDSRKAGSPATEPTVTKKMSPSTRAGFQNLLSLLDKSTGEGPKSAPEQA